LFEKALIYRLVRTIWKEANTRWNSISSIGKSRDILALSKNNCGTSGILWAMDSSLWFSCCHLIPFCYSGSRTLCYEILREDKKKLLGIGDRARKSRLLLILTMKMVNFGPFFSII
jgi:hypothetical protein